MFVCKHTEAMDHVQNNILFKKVHYCITALVKEINEKN